MSKLTERKEWQALSAHYQKIKNQHISAFFAMNPHRQTNYMLSTKSICLDYSRQFIQDETIQLLTHLANACQLKSHIEKLFLGEKVNFTENRPALHTALRDSSNKSILVDDENILPLIKTCREKMRALSETLRQHLYRGGKGKVVTDIVNIGIGGSDLGPRLAINALAPFKNTTLNCHFIANVDGYVFKNVTEHLNPDTTLFIVSSKSFYTAETLLNAETAKQWLHEKALIEQQMIAITDNTEEAIAFGILPENIFPIWPWIGGRYSLWSAIGLPIMINFGYDIFTQLLNGAEEIDQHVLNTPFEKNIPAMMALISIWNNNFLGCQSQAIVPYSETLQLFPMYCQQLIMESNGKSTTCDNELVDYHTAPIIWGDIGCNSQHAFFQELHQGTKTIPVDFILPLSPRHELQHHHNMLIASCLAQAEALVHGNELTTPHQKILGNKPSNILFFNKLTPTVLGTLIALYEHKTYIESIIWGIDSFDQWGVEIGKRITKDIYKLVSQQNELTLDNLNQFLNQL